MFHLQQYLWCALFRVLSNTKCMRYQIKCTHEYEVYNWVISPATGRPTQLAQWLAVGTINA